MGSIPWLNLLTRWIHILSAMLAVGGPFFMRFMVTSAARRILDEPARQQFHEAIMRRWRHVVYLLITLLLITGFYTYFVVARWADPSFSRQDKVLYQMLFGIKFIAAMTMFVLASALAGRMATFAPIRRSAGFWTLVFLVLGVVVVVCAGVLRYLPFHPVRS